MIMINDSNNDKDNSNNDNVINVDIRGIISLKLDIKMIRKRLHRTNIAKRKTAVDPRG